jgi:hypothetical protein
MSAMPKPTNKTVPTGGVHKPIQRFTSIIIPKWIGERPKFVAIGKKIGVKMRIAGDMSIKVPTINRTILIISNMIYLLLELIKGGRH